MKPKVHRFQCLACVGQRSDELSLLWERITVMFAVSFAWGDTLYARAQLQVERISQERAAESNPPRGADPLESYASSSFEHPRAWIRPRTRSLRSPSWSRCFSVTGHTQIPRPPCWLGENLRSRRKFSAPATRRASCSSQRDRAKAPKTQEFLPRAARRLVALRDSRGGLGVFDRRSPCSTPGTNAADPIEGNVSAARTDGGVRSHRIIDLRIPRQEGR